MPELKEEPANPFVANPYAMPVPNAFWAPGLIPSGGESKDDQY